MIAEAYIAFGSNVGDRRANMREARTLLAKHAEILTASSVYSTEPVGYLDQGWYLNAVVKVRTELTPREMLNALQAIERTLGRERRIRNGPRTIDLDILLWGDTVVTEDGLTIPHPRAHERLFVMAPWAEIAPDLVIPGTGRTAAEWRDELMGTSQVEAAVTGEW
jgi:2-amino-4-hydroxy-6-hydroxymethyldihydropteridine diphosphokinase